LAKVAAVKYQITTLEADWQKKAREYEIDPYSVSGDEIP
jgi:hypothetical protein